AGNGGPGYEPDPTEGELATSVHVFPASIVFDVAGNLLIAEGNRVRRVDSSGTILTIAGGGSNFADGLPPTFVFLQSISGIAVDLAGNLYIVENEKSRVRIVTQGGTGSPILTGISTTSALQGTTISATLTGF